MSALAVRTNHRGLRGRGLHAALVLSLGLSVALLDLTAPLEGPQVVEARKHAKRAKGEKAQVDLFEKVAFPNEEMEKKALVKAPKVQQQRGRRVPAVARRAPAASTAGSPGLAPPPPDPEGEGAAAPAPAPPPPVAAAKAPPRPEMPTTLRPQGVSAETGASIDALVSKALVPTEAPARAAAPSEPSGGHLDMAEIGNAMKPVREKVRKGCAFGKRGVVLMRITTGPDGVVMNATPEGALASRPEAACVSNAVKAARFPASANSTFRYPFPVR